jgi:UDP-glucose 4-epimerase
MSVCLVTGGAGFIGSHIVDALIRDGHRVRVLDNFSTGNPSNLTEVLERIELINGDLTDPATARSAVDGVEVVFHQAALASVARSLDDPMATHHVNATGTLTLLLAARDAGVRRFIYAASSSAYGNSPKLPKQECDPTHPLSPYAASKLLGEYYCEIFAHLYSLETVRLRYFNVYGPRQRADSAYAAVIPRFLAALIDGQRPVIYGDGNQSRDFTYVSDVVQANLLAAQAHRVSGKVYNVACGSQISLLAVLRCANGLHGTDIQAIHAAPRLGDVRHSLADTSLAQADLGFCSSVDTAKGLERCLKYWLDEKQAVDSNCQGDSFSKRVFASLV